jgi:hypothetical protein
MMGARARARAREREREGERERGREGEMQSLVESVLSSSVRPLRFVLFGSV